MRQPINYCLRCGEINLPNTHYYLENFTKRFCAMRCRSVYKTEMEDRKLKCLNCMCEVKAPHQYYFCTPKCFDEAARNTRWRMLRDGLSPTGFSAGSPRRNGPLPHFPRRVAHAAMAVTVGRRPPGSSMEIGAAAQRASGGEWELTCPSPASEPPISA
jgi:hypothetical protein